MIEEYNKSLQVFINQKNLLLDKANEKDLEPEILNNIINQICMLDDKIKEYNNLIKNENSKDNKIHNHIINDNDYNNEEKQPNNSPENALNKMKTQNNYKKNNKKSNSGDNNDSENEIENEDKNKTNIYKNIKIEKEIIDKIKKEKGKTKNKILQPYNNIETIYTLKYITKTTYYYQCSKRPKCKGKAKFIIEKEKFYITEFCEDNEIHNKLTYELFEKIMNDNNLNMVDFNIKKNQHNLIEYIFRNSNNIENINIKSEYNKYTKIKLKLSPNEISRIKTNIIGKFCNLNISECIRKINNENIILDIIENDITILKHLNQN